MKDILFAICVAGIPVVGVLIYAKRKYGRSIRSQRWK